MTSPSLAAVCPGCFKDKGGSNPCPHCGFNERTERPAQALPLRTLLQGQYLIGRVLGKPGGFGITYLAFDRNLETTVAIKEYLPRDLATRTRDGAGIRPHTADEGELFRYGLEQFLAEARTLARLDHPNIVRVRQFFEANGSAYLVMDYYRGLSLAEHLDRQPQGRLPEALALALIHPVLDGLRAVHAQGFLHRDIKPQNIYLAKTERGGARPILLDFGAARQAFGERSQSISVLVSAGFAPFEQYSRKGQGPATDVYAAAAVLYRMLTGVTPPPSPERVGSDELVPARAFGVSGPVSEVIAQAMAIGPAARPQTVEALQRLLVAAAAGQVLAVAPDPGQAARPVSPAPALSADEEIVVGPNNTAFYLKRFERFRERPFQARVSWNWPCFFLNFLWFFYRKLWLVGLLVALGQFAVTFVAAVLLAVIVSMVTPLSGDEVETMASVMGALVSRILVPMYANAFYYGHVRRLIAKVRAGPGTEAEQEAILRRRGGVSMPVLWVLVALLVGSILLVALND